MQIPLLLIKKLLKIGTARPIKTAVRKKRAAKAICNDPELKSIWDSVQSDYFPDRVDLKEYKVLWSTRRQKRVLASVSLKQKKVRVAKELKDPLLKEFLDPLLYHEMCHAVLGDQVGKMNGKNAWHGPKFKKLEQAHPRMKFLEAWIKSGGWAKAVRVSRGKDSWVKRSK